MAKKDQVDDLELRLSKLLTAKSVVLTQGGGLHRGLQPISK